MFLRCNDHFKTLGLKILHEEVGFIALFVVKPYMDMLIIPFVKPGQARI